MDGNGRWAAGRGQPRTQGHQAGADALKIVVRAAGRRGVTALTVFAFSSENWQRPRQEVVRLMELFMRALRREIGDLHENGVRLQFIGERGDFSTSLQRAMERAEARTAGNTGLRLNVAVNYGGRWDIVQAARRLVEDVAAGRLAPGAIDESRLARHICLADLPPPDLFIRTGGERRLSNFLLWQSAYTELYFTPCLWPDFNADELDTAIADYAGRERRYGQISGDNEHA